MFGEEILVGQKEMSIDIKGRAFLPAFTKREKDDELFLIFDDEIENYVLYSKKAFEENVNKLEELVLTADSKEKRLEYKLLLFKFYESILRRCVVDKQGRIALSDAFEPGTVVNTIGAKDRLILVRKNDSKKSK